MFRNCTSSLFRDNEPSQFYLIQSTPPPAHFSILLYTSAALGFVLTNYVALLCPETGQPWSRKTPSKHARSEVLTAVLLQIEGPVSLWPLEREDEGVSTLRSVGRYQRSTFTAQHRHVGHDHLLTIPCFSITHDNFSHLIRRSTAPVIWLASLWHSRLFVLEEHNLRSLRKLC